MSGNKNSGRRANPLSLRQKAIAAGLAYRTVWKRLKMGWTVERALTPAKAKITIETID